jgi:hypothetical protein
VSGPDFDSFVEGAPPEERERLRVVHELLVAAGPPPELPPALAEPPPERVRRAPPLTTLPRRRFGAALTLAAGTAVAAFGIGYLVGAINDSGSSPKFVSVVDLRMTPTAAAPGAAAVLRIGKKEAGGNIPLAVTATGLTKVPKGGYYELWLTKKSGKTERRVLSCGTFLPPEPGVSVRLNAPYTLEHDVGWVITRHLRGSKTEPVLLTT